MPARGKFLKAPGVENMRRRIARQANTTGKAEFLVIIIGPVPANVQNTPTLNQIPSQPVLGVEFGQPLQRCGQGRRAYRHAEHTCERNDVSTVERLAAGRFLPGLGRLGPNPRPAASSFRNPGGPSLRTPPPLVAAGRGNSKFVFMADSPARALVIAVPIVRTSDSYLRHPRPRWFSWFLARSTALSPATQLRPGPLNGSRNRHHHPKKR